MCVRVCVCVSEIKQTQQTDAAEAGFLGFTLNRRSEKRVRECEDKKEAEDERERERKTQRERERESYIKELVHNVLISFSHLVVFEGTFYSAGS